MKLFLKLTDNVIKQNLRQLVYLLSYTGWLQVYSMLRR